MTTSKQVPELVHPVIKQTSTKIEPIRFREDIINKIRKQNITFGNKERLYIPFLVSKDSHQKGLLLRVSKGPALDNKTKKVFYLRFWFNGKSCYHKLGEYSQNFGTKECNDLLIKLHDTHTDHKTGFWIKSPNETAKDEKRIVPKEDTSLALGKTINETIESYCGSDEDEGHRGFLKDLKQGHKTSKSAKTIWRCLAGYNKRQSLVTFEDDNNGYAVRKFLSNKHLRIQTPASWKDLFRKFPSGHGIIKDREYYNRRQKKTYVIPASKNKSIYDSSLGKSLIEDLTPGDVEHWCKDLTSMEVKKDYVKVFTSLWIWARKRGWLGTNPGLSPISLETVYVKKEIRKDSIYTDISISLPELEIFHESCEELSKDFPFKAELHQLMAVTGIRKAEALKLKKEYINFDEKEILLPKGINKQRYKDQIVTITPEVEIVLRNILDMGDRKGFSHYKMKDFPWLFPTRKWKEDRYFDKEFRMGIQGRLGGDEGFIPVLRKRMRQKLGDPDLVYAPKLLRKTFITLSRQQLDGRSDKVKHLSRHSSEGILEANYDKPGRAEIQEWGNKATSIMTFIKRRA